MRRLRLSHGAVLTVTAGAVRAGSVPRTRSDHPKHFLVDSSQRLNAR